MTSRIANRVKEAADAHGITVAMVLSPARAGLAARYQAWAKLKDDGLSLHQIADAFGYDHSTVLYGIRRHNGGEGRTRAPKPVPPPAPPVVTNPVRDEGLRIVLENMAAMQAKHQRDLAQRY